MYDFKEKNIVIVQRKKGNSRETTYSLHIVAHVLLDFCRKYHLFESKKDFEDKNPSLF